MRILKNISFLLILVTLSLTGHAQSGISLYHQTNQVFQNNHINPAFIPDGQVFLGLPVLSGISVDLNVPVSYNDLVTTNENGNLEWNADGVVNNSGNRNWINFESEISTFYLGIRPNNTSAVSFFIRERIGARGFYNKDVLDVAWNGNAQFVDRQIDLSKTVVDARYYREYGIGIWKSMPKIGLNYGIRFKMLNGMISAVTEKGAGGSVFTHSDNYQIDVALQNATVNVAGHNIFEAEGSELRSHLVTNGNMGYGLDLGAHLRMTEQFSVAVSVTDLGYINWKVDPENFSVLDTTFQYQGVDLQDLDQLESTLGDSIKTKFVDTTTVKSYRTGLNSKFYASSIYQITENDQIMATIANHFVRGKWRMLYGIGYTHRFGRKFSVSANAVRTPQHGIDMGLSYALNLGAFQMYMATDRLIRVWNIPETKAFDLRFGFNFVFGRGKNEKKDDRSDLNHKGAYYGNKKIEKSDGIYWIIPRQKPNPIYKRKKFKGEQASPAKPSPRTTQGSSG